MSNAPISQGLDRETERLLLWVFRGTVFNAPMLMYGMVPRTSILIASATAVFKQLQPPYHNTKFAIARVDLHWGDYARYDVMRFRAYEIIPQNGGVSVGYYRAPILLGSED